MCAVVYSRRDAQSSAWCTVCLFSQAVPYNSQMRGKIYNQPSYKNDILHYFTQYANFRGCQSVEQPHLPNCTRFWVINLSSIAVEPSTNGQYGGLEPN